MTNEGDLIQQFEQMETNLVNIAQLMATYYSSLIEKDVPEALAQKLVVDYNTVMFQWAYGVSGSGDVTLSLGGNDEEDI
jgi:hypothetical protein